MARSFLHAVGLVITRPTNCKWNAARLNPTMRNIIMQISFKLMDDDQNGNNIKFLTNFDSKLN
jgi:hypothetical protein